MQPMFAKQRAHRAESQCKSDFGRNTISFKVPYFACEYRVFVCVYVREQIKTIESIIEFLRLHGINKIMAIYKNDDIDIHIYTSEKIRN